MLEPEFLTLTGPDTWPMVFVLDVTWELKRRKFPLRWA